MTNLLVSWANLASSFILELSSKFPIRGKFMSEGEGFPTLERLREIQRRIEEMKAAEAARLRYVLERVKNLENGGSTRKRRRPRKSGGLLPNGAISPEQIERIQHYRSICMSYGEISDLMGISKSSAHKYRNDIQSNSEPSGDQ